MASLVRQSSTVSGGKAVPVASIAAQPTRPSRVSKRVSKRSSTRRRTLSPSATTSLPIPSPGSTAILRVANVDPLDVRGHALGGGAVLGVVDQLVNRLEVGAGTGGDDVEGRRSEERRVGKECISGW